jgi:hypothetical protein
MTILTWELSTSPTQTPEYWLLFVDGNALCSLGNQAPYIGVGAYSVDLTKLDSNVILPTDGSPHAYSVALVGGGSIGPQSPTVSVTLSPVVTLPSPPAVPPPGPVWPAAGALTVQAKVSL